MAEIMVDWITGSIVPHLELPEAKIFDTGRFIEVSPHGELLKQFSSRIFHKGSFDNRLAFRAPYANQLEMSGNPVKYFQGHNLFGSDDYLGLFISAGADARKRNAQFPGAHTYKAYGFFRPKFTRLDLTRSYRFNSNEEARAWLKNVAAHGRAKSGSAQLKSDTVYFGKNSTHWTMKIYQKFDEINSGKKDHEISSKLSTADKDLLFQWAEGVVRFELTLRGPEIEKLPYSFDLLEVWNTYFKRIHFNENGEVFDMTQVAEKFNLTPTKKLLLISWGNGVDIRTMYAEKSFYRVRKQILDATDLDISVPFVPNDTDAVRVALKMENWDPKPIEHLFFKPSDELKKHYGLDREKFLDFAENFSKVHGH